MPDLYEGGPQAWFIQHKTVRGCIKVSYRIGLTRNQMDLAAWRCHLNQYLAWERG